MALINPELIALARIKVTATTGDTPGTGTVTEAVYDYSNGFDAVSVKGALEGANPIIIDGHEIVLFLADPQQPGTALNPPTTLPSQGGVKATFSIVKVSTATDPSPTSVPNGLTIKQWQYGDYALSAPYAKVDPQKALRVIFYFPATLSEVVFYMDVSVFKNPMTLYK